MSRQPTDDAGTAALNRTVFISISRGWFLRLFLFSGVLERLTENTPHRYVLLVPPPARDEIAREFSRPGRVEVEDLPVGDAGALGARLYSFGLHRVQGVRLLRRLWQMLELPLTYSRLYRGCFARYLPDLVVTASMGIHSPDDPPLIREARRAGIPTMCVVWSWDNLSMKGPIVARPDRLAVWNERMHDEAVRLQLYSRRNLDVTGVPQFDHYFRPGSFKTREAFFAELGLDPAKPLITLATAPVGSVADHRFLVKMMVDAVASRAFGQDAQLLCRTHPMEASDFYREFEGLPGVRFDHPGVHRSGLGWSPDRAESYRLANTLKHTDVLVNIASTVTIEAAILDRPIVNVAFSTSEPERFAVMVLKNHYGAHFKHVFDTGASTIVRSHDELIQAVRQYMHDPSVKKAERRKLALEVCHALDGRGAERVATLIDKHAVRGQV